jgi:hypothetical protein
MPFLLAACPPELTREMPVFLPSFAKGFTQPHAPVQAHPWRQEYGGWIELVLSSRIRSCHWFPLVSRRQIRTLARPRILSPRPESIRVQTVAQNTFPFSKDGFSRHGLILARACQSPVSLG